MDNKTTKVLINLFAGILGFGLGLIAISFFLGMIEASMPMLSISSSLGIFDADWSTMDSSPLFIAVSFLVLIVGILIMITDFALKQAAKKQVKCLNYIALAIILVGLILVIVSTIVTKNSVKDEMVEMLVGALPDESPEYADMSSAQLELIIGMFVTFKLGMGAVMAIIGGVFALIGGVLLVLPQFNPITIAKTTAVVTPTSPVAPYTTATAYTAATEQPAATPATEQPADHIENTNNDDTVK